MNSDVTLTTRTKKSKSKPKKNSELATLKKLAWENPTNKLAIVTTKCPNYTDLEIGDLVRIHRYVNEGTKVVKVSVVKSENVRFEAGFQLEVKNLDIVLDFKELKLEAEPIAESVRTNILSLVENQNRLNTENSFLNSFNQDLVLHLTKLCSDVGVEIKSIPENTLTEILSQPNRRNLGRKFYEYYDVNKDLFKNTVTEFTKEEEETLKSFKINENSEYINDIKVSMDIFLSKATRYAESAAIELTLAATERNKLLHIYMQKVNLMKEIRKIESLNFYKFEKEKSVLVSNSGNLADIKLYFSTKDVVISRHVENAVDLRFNFGSFLVEYVPFLNTVKVFRNKDNSEHSYYHPNVHAFGAVCWGTANEVYQDAMTLLEPYKAFEALKILLQTDGGTPYRDLYHFVVEKEDQKIVVDSDNKIVSTKLGYILNKTGLPKLIRDTNLITMEGDTVFIEIFKHSETNVRYFLIDAVTKTYVSAENKFKDGIIVENRLINI